MKLQQLRYVAEIAKQGNHLSAAAEALNTSQPGVSRQIQVLEGELGVDIFRRTRNRIIGLTEPGEHVLAIAKRVTADVATLRSLKMDLEALDQGQMVIATTHTQARYVLPNIVASFIKRYPKVELILKQGDPETICAMVEDGEADFSVGPETQRNFPELLRLQGNEIHRIVVGPSGHSIFSEPELTYENLAAHPLIAYDTRYSGRWKVMEAFQRAGCTPRFALSAIDADVSKTYALLDLGLAILTNVAYNPAQDIGLEARDASHLFPPSTTTITLRPTSYIRPYVLEFISSLSENLSLRAVRSALKSAIARD
ncbi:LysR substrate-binding domain-containing protein [Aquibium sp. LZ166]|uniref:LysR substrate-binding domain-containing protein n=1 Tax=Aquibium pacificus TaxID=3153579 RepID=A0ABV3SRX8_9HYPH